MNEFKYNPNISQKQTNFFKRDWWLQENVDLTLHPISLVVLASGWWLKRNFGHCYNITMLIGLGNNKATWVWARDDVLRLARLILKRSRRDKIFIDKLINQWKKSVNKFYSFSQKINPELLSQLNNQELLKYYKKFYELYLDEFSLPLLADSIGTYIEEIFSESFRKFLSKRKKDHLFADCFSLLTSPINKSFHNEEEISLLKIAIHIKRKGKLFEVFQKGTLKDIQEILTKFSGIENLVTNHIQKFFWLENNYVRTLRLDKKYFIKKLQRLLKESKDFKTILKEKNLFYAKIRKEKRKLIQRFKLLKKFRIIIEAGEKFIWWHDQRKKANLIANHHLDSFLEEIGKRINISLQRMKFTLPCEIEEILLKNKIPLKEIDQRMKGYIFICLPNSFELVVDKNEIEKLKNYILSLESPKSKEVKGMVASVGNQKMMRGRVKIVLSSKELFKLQKGDILVAGMTRPDYLRGLGKAAAIITDEGGATCHAAIVSRELGIPCIIGTKIATKVLKDGDWVEVDAGKGLVKILKK